MLNQQNTFDTPGRPSTSVRWKATIINESSPKRRAQPDKLVIPTRAPKNLQEYAVAMSNATGATLKTIYQEGAERFMEEAPWKNGLKWQVTKGLTRKVNGENRDTGWMQVNVALSTDICNQIERLSTEQGVSRSTVVYTMMYWWIVCPPTDERRRRTAFDQIQKPLSAEDMLARQSADTDMSSSKQPKAGSGSRPKKNFDGNQVARKFKEMINTNQSCVDLGLFLRKTIDETGISKAELARRLVRSDTWVKSVLAKASPEAIEVAARIGVSPDVMGAGESLRLISWANDTEKWVVLDAIAAEIRGAAPGTGRAYSRALLDAAEDRYEICRRFPKLADRTDLSLEDLRWVRMMFQSNDEAKKKAAITVIDGGLMPEKQLISAVEDATDANNLVAEASMELSEKDRELSTLREQAFAQNVQILALRSQVAAQTPESDVSACSDGPKAFLEDRLSKSGNLVLLLDYLKAFYGDRVVVLESAFRSAKESDGAGFDPIPKAAGLLFKLAGEYVRCCREDMRSSIGVEVFGNKSYAPGEGCDKGSAKERDVKAARTFSGYVMMEHLKIDGGWSRAKTLRIHFKYDGDIGKVVIGHCGPHLP
jgi:hypothetical protein